MPARSCRRAGGSRRRRTVELGEDIRSPAGKQQLLTVLIDGNVATSTFRTSSTITSMSRAAGWIEIEAAVDLIPAGSTVEVTLF